MQSDSFENINLDGLLKASGWQSRYRILMAWSKVVSLKQELREDQYKVPGCDADVWLHHEIDSQGIHHFYFDSDSRIIKGLVVLALVQVNAKNTKDIDLKMLDSHIDAAGLSRHLSASRANGFSRILNKIKECL